MASPLQLCLDSLCLYQHVSRAQGCRCGQGLCFHSRVSAKKKKKSRTNIFYDNVDQNMLLKKILRSFIFTRHSTAEMLSVSQVIDRNGKKCRHRPAISFAQCASQGRSPLCCTLPCWLRHGHAGDSMVLVPLTEGPAGHMKVPPCLPAFPHLPLAGSPHLQITRAQLNLLHSGIICSECRQDSGDLSSPSTDLAKESDCASLTFDQAALSYHSPSKSALLP